MSDSEELSFGEQVYREFVDAGQRSRFAYADVQILKNVSSIEELRELCSTVSGETFSDDTTATEMVAACVVRGPDQSEAGEMLEGMASGGLEGCLLGLFTLPVIFAAMLPGMLIRATGLNLSEFADRQARSLWVTAAVSLFAAITLSAVLQRAEPLWLATLTGISIGLLSTRRTGPHLNSSLEWLWILVPAVLLMCIIFLSEQLSIPFTIWPTLGYLAGVGTGYGMCRTPSELLEKKRRPPPVDGMISLQQQHP